MDLQITLNSVDTLNRDVPIPLYYQLKRFVLARIKSKDWQAGYQIPSEQQFCEKFGISRPTVRQAIGELISEGHLTRKHRKVTISKTKMDSNFFNKLQSFNAEMKAKNLAPSTSVLALDIRSCPEASEKLSIDKDEPCIYLERLRFADEEPIGWIESYIPQNAMPELLNVDFEQISLYQAIEKEYKIQVERADRMFEVALATTHEADILGIKKGDPLFHVKTVSYDKYNEPLEFSVSRYRGDRNQFMVSLHR